MFYINFFVIIYLLVFQFFCIAQSTSKYNSVSNATESGLIFEKESDYKFVDSFSNISPVFNDLDTKNSKSGGSSPQQIICFN